MWEWWDDTIDAVTDAVDDGWSWVTDTAEDIKEEAERLFEDSVATVNDWFDYYAWDASEGVGIVEGWLKDTFAGPYETGKGIISEVGTKITDWFDDTFYTPEEAWEAAKEDLEDAWNRDVEDFDAWWKRFQKEAAATAATAAASVGDLITNISMSLGVGFDFAMAALGSLPELFSGFRDELADWFHFDITEFFGQVSDMQAKSKGEEEP
ncbi:hypothetical protein ES705_24671 [subsurface metagenome]